jgi:hypothetical protein
MRKSLKLAVVVLGCLLPVAVAQAARLTEPAAQAVLQSIENTQIPAHLVGPPVVMAEPSALILLAVDLLAVVAVTMLVRRRASR